MKDKEIVFRNPNYHPSRLTVLRSRVFSSCSGNDEETAMQKDSQWP
jgi:hypothetical protein